MVLDDMSLVENDVLELESREEEVVRVDRVETRDDHVVVVTDKVFLFVVHDFQSTSEDLGLASWKESR